MKTKIHPPLLPLRIVPMHAPVPILPLKEPEARRKKKPHPKPPAAHLVYNGGPLLSAVKVYTVFWGLNWKNTQSFKDLANYINGFFTAILTSALIDELAEYDVPGYKIGHGSFAGSSVITANAPSGTIDDTAIQTTLQSWISTDKNFPKPDPNTLYFIYTDSGVTVSLQGSESCSSFCGYHNSIGVSQGQTIYYAVMPYPSCSGCLGGLTVENVLTGTSSHELCEAITDPVPGSGWYDNTQGEIGDICAWKFKTIGGYTVQLEWSNKNKKCI